MKQPVIIFDDRLFFMTFFFEKGVVQYKLYQYAKGDLSHRTGKGRTA